MIKTHLCNYIFGLLLSFTSCDHNEIRSFKESEYGSVTSDTIITLIDYKGKTFNKYNDTTYRWTADSTDWEILTTFENGEIKRLEHQGFFNSCGVIVDTSFYFDPSGNLIKTIYHDHWMPLGAVSCKESMEDLLIREFYPNGSLKAKKRYRRGYQGEQKEVGMWETFDENGNLLSTKNYTDSFDVIRILNSSYLERMEAMMVNSSLTSNLAKNGFVLTELRSETLTYESVNNNQKIHVSMWETEESFFQVKYWMDSLSLLSFINDMDTLKYEKKETKRFHPKASSFYFTKKGLGSHETKEVQVFLHEDKIVYTHWVGKVLNELPVEIKSQNRNH